MKLFFALRSERYQVPAQYSFQQIYFKADADAEAQARDLAAQFNDSEPTAERLPNYGDHSMLVRAMHNVSEPEVARIFGNEFAANLSHLSEHKWSGPVRSTYGMHVVKLTQLEQAHIPELNQVREQVETDLRYETSEAAKEQAYLELASKYELQLSDEAQALMEDANAL